ncbi:MAG: helix-turn-helix domain-containing protein, partial [Acidobacteriota bacterium]
TAYVHLARVTRAVTLLRTTAKVESVAWDVGYRSKKDLYAALSRWAGSTPSELRALSDDECAWLERELRIRCLRGMHAYEGVRPISPRPPGGDAPEPAGRRASRR